MRPVNRYLRHDAPTGELRLVLADLWNGTHEVTEYRVLNEDGRLVRRREDLDGAAVLYSPGFDGTMHEVPRPWPAQNLRIRVESAPVVETRSDCRRALNPRNRRCGGCEAVR